MKKFTGLVLILAVLILGSYYGMGYLTERKVKEDLEVINQSNGVTTNLVQYKRGWFTSEASLDWNIHIPERVMQSGDGQTQTVPAQDYQLQMPVTIYHGPVIFSDRGIKFGLGYAHTELPLPQQYVEQFNTLFTSESSQPKLDLSFFVNYFANSSFDMSVPAFKLITKEGNAQFDWLGMTSSTDISASRDTINGKVTIDGLNFNKDQVNATMSAVTSEYNLYKDKLDFYLGDVSLSFPSMLVSVQDKKLFELNQFSIHSDASIDDGLLNSHFKTSLEKIISNDKTYGPGNLEVALRNLDAQSWARINTQLNQAQQSTELERQKAMLSLLPELPKLFGKGAEFEISEMNLAVPEGTIEGNLFISLPKGEMGNPFELLQKIQGHGKLKVPALIVKQLITESIKQKLGAPQSIQQGLVQQMQQQAGVTPDSGVAANAAVTTGNDSVAATQQATVEADKQLAAMLESGLLTQQSSDYVIEVNFNQGQLMVNGKPFDSAMMKF